LLGFTNNTDSARGISYAGTTDSDVYFAWSQFEAGSFPTTYIPTTTTSATRNADVLTYSAVGNADSFPMTVSVEVTGIGPADNSLNYYDLNIDDGTNGDHVFSVRGGGLSGHYAQVQATTLQADLFSSSKRWLSGVTERRTVAVGSNDAEMYVDGLSIASDSSVSFPSGITTIRIGTNYLSAKQSHGTIRNVKIYAKRLSDAQVASI